MANYTSAAAFYAEMRTNKTLMTPIEFLMRAWKKSETDFFFHGVPEHVIVPTAVFSKIPGGARSAGTISSRLPFRRPAASGLAFTRSGL